MSLLCYILKSTRLPVHVTPSPEYPRRHAQWNDPLVLVQLASAWQLWALWLLCWITKRCSRHSSISVCRMNKLSEHNSCKLSNGSGFESVLYICTDGISRMFLTVRCLGCDGSVSISDTKPLLLPVWYAEIYMFFSPAGIKAGSTVPPITADLSQWMNNVFIFVWQYDS